METNEKDNSNPQRMLVEEDVLIQQQEYINPKIINNKTTKKFKSYNTRWKRRARMGPNQEMTSKVGSSRSRKREASDIFELKNSHQNQPMELVKSPKKIQN